MAFINAHLSGWGANVFFSKLNVKFTKKLIKFVSTFHFAGQIFESKYYVLTLYFHSWLETNSI